MKDLENNKIAAAILVAGLIAIIAGKISDGLYHPEHEPEKRGYQVEVAEIDDSGAAEEKEEVVIDIAALMASADAAAGEKGFKKCAACHSLEPGVHRVGPSLAGIYNSKIASKSGYSYSNALSAIDKNWTDEELFHFLKKPGKYAKGTKMTFAGLKKPEDKANIIAFLKTK